MRKWLIDIRNQKNLTQEEVAKKSNISRSAYSNIELGVRSPSVDMAKKIARTLCFDWTIFFANDCPEMKQK